MRMAMGYSLEATVQYGSLRCTAYSHIRGSSTSPTLSDGLLPQIIP